MFGALLAFFGFDVDEVVSSIADFCAVSFDFEATLVRERGLGIGIGACCITLFLMALALLAYFNVFRVSSKLEDVGLIFEIMTVLQFPPNESYETAQNYQSWKGLPSTGASASNLDN